MWPSSSSTACFSVSGQATVTGTGVVIYNAPAGPGDAISISGQAGVTLCAPTTGYQGIALWQDRSSNVPIMVTGNGTLCVTGAVYAAQASINVSGQDKLVQKSNSFIMGHMIAFDLNVFGNGSISVNLEECEHNRNNGRLLAHH
jgi:hypothetical protein